MSIVFCLYAVEFQKQFYLKQFSLAWVHNLIVKNISISNN